MRGKPYIEAARAVVDRIIPAHAGQTGACILCPLCYTDHPRACGANPQAMSAVSAVHGSSPRMRGKRARRLGSMRNVRIIPAHAGQTR